MLAIQLIVYVLLTFNQSEKNMMGMTVQLIVSLLLQLDWCVFHIAYLRI